MEMSVDSLFRHRVEHLSGLGENRMEQNQDDIHSGKITFLQIRTRNMRVPFLKFSSLF